MRFSSRSFEPHFYDLTPERAFLKIKGEDRLEFLNGLATNKITELGEKTTEEGFDKDGMYTAFLTPQGRIYFEGFIHNDLKNGDSVVVEINKNYRDLAMDHFNKYMLLSNVEISDVTSQFKLLNLPQKFMAENFPLGLPKFLNRKILEVLNASFGCVDCRVPKELGIRALFSNDEPTPFKEQKKLSVVDYYKRLTELGVAEMDNGIVSGQSLPMESNLELLNGVHFRKGCYIGQELTIRTHHKGVIRKRILPFSIVDGSVSKVLMPKLGGADVYLPIDESQKKSKRKPIGKLLTLTDGQGLGLFRLEILDICNGSSINLEAIVYDSITDYSFNLELLVEKPAWMNI